MYFIARSVKKLSLAYCHLSQRIDVINVKIQTPVPVSIANNLSFWFFFVFKLNPAHLREICSGKSQKIKISGGVLAACVAGKRALLELA
jgi:hypothetical protein